MKNYKTIQKLRILILDITAGHPITDVEKLHFYIVGRNFVGDFVTKGVRMPS